VIKWRDELRTRFSRRYDYQRALNKDSKSLRQWASTVQCVIDEKGIQPEDIYNFDEIGFAMGLISAQKVVTRQTTTIGDLSNNQKIANGLLLSKQSAQMAIRYRHA
jgi:hypothetical protein